MSKDYENDNYLDDELEYDDYDDSYVDEFDGLEVYDSYDEAEYDLEGEYEDYDDEELEDFREVILTLEDDSELKAIVVAQFDVEGKDYIALLPVENDEHSDILLYRAVYSDDEETFEVELIEDEDEFDLVTEAYYDNVDFDDEDLLALQDHHHHHHEGCGCGHEDCECDHDHDHCDCEPGSCQCGHEHE